MRLRCTKLLFAVLLLTFVLNASTGLCWRYPVGDVSGDGWINDKGLQWLDRYDYDYGIPPDTIKVSVPHPGTDFNMDGTSGDGDAGQPVFAVSDGKVIHSEYSSGWGNLIVIEHSVDHCEIGKEPIYSVYAHLDEIRVGIDSVVDESQIIGTVGDTGTGDAHLHFEIRSSRLTKQPEYTSPKYFPYFKDEAWISQHYYNPIDFLNTNLSSYKSWSQTVTATVGDGITLSLDETISLTQVGNELTGSLVRELDLEGYANAEPIFASANVSGIITGDLWNLSAEWNSEDSWTDDNYWMTTGEVGSTIELNLMTSGYQDSLSPVFPTTALWWNGEPVANYGSYALVNNTNIVDGLTEEEVRFDDGR